MCINNVSFTVEKTSSIKPLRLKSDGNISVPKYDNAYISPIGKDLSFVKKVLKDVPNIREDKVKEIKTRIENGTYEVSPEDFANKLLGL